MQGASAYYIALRSVCHKSSVSRALTLFYNKACGEGAIMLATSCSEDKYKGTAQREWCMRTTGNWAATQHKLAL